jgi:hypothetical protein
MMRGMQEMLNFMEQNGIDDEKKPPGLWVEEMKQMTAETLPSESKCSSKSQDSKPNRQKRMASSSMQYLPSPFQSKVAYRLNGKTPNTNKSEPDVKCTLSVTIQPMPGPRKKKRRLLTTPNSNKDATDLNKDDPPKASNSFSSKNSRAKSNHPKKDVEADIFELKELDFRKGTIVYAQFPQNGCKSQD